MKKVMIYNPSDYRILFLLTAVIKAGYRLSYAHNLKSLWTAEEIILLNIDSSKKSQLMDLHPDLDVFIDLKFSKISTWLNFPGKFDQNNADVQNILNYFDSQLQADSLDLINQKKWIQNLSVARYGMALRTAKILSMNKKDMRGYQEILINAAYNLAKGQNDSNIDSFAIQYQRVLDSTENCYQRISTKQKLINLPAKEIAFGYLDTISNYLDFSSLRERCLNNHPFLTIIQYR